jgi:hypothetical protein
MPKPQLIPDELRLDLERLILVEKQPHSVVLNWLAEKGVICQARTLKAYCKKWNISRHVAFSDTVVSFIDTAFHTTLHSDTMIARQLNDQGFPISARQVRSVRTAKGWKHRTRGSEERQQNWTETFNRVGEALAEGTVRSYGREMVQSNLRQQQGYRAREDDVRNALKLQDPVGTETRKPGMKRKRRLEYIVPGPNYLWSIDGHDKLAKYGIEIYGAIDAYSRRILWFYVGNSNRTQLSVVQQFLSAVQHYNLCPDYIRSDRGSETPLVADAQYNFYIHKRRAEGLSEDALRLIPLRECYFYGVSTSNVKIERFWRSLIEGMTLPWMVRTTDFIFSCDFWYISAQIRRLVRFTMAARTGREIKHRFSIISGVIANG